MEILFSGIKSGHHTGEKLGVLKENCFCSLQLPKLSKISKDCFKISLFLHMTKGTHTILHGL